MKMRKAEREDEGTPLMEMAPPFLMTRMMRREAVPNAAMMI